VRTSGIFRDTTYTFQPCAKIARLGSWAFGEAGAVWRPDFPDPGEYQGNGTHRGINRKMRVVVAET
jgi:hypothetical protein